MPDDTALTQLKRCPIFSSLDDAMLAPLAAISRERAVDADEWLFRAGDEAAGFYLILEGHLLVLREQQGRSEVLARLCPGDAVAESVFFDPQPHASSVRARGAARVLELPAEQARATLRENAGLAMAVLHQAARIMQRRLRYASSSGKSLARVYDTTRTRSEHDLLGDLEVPADALYGVQTLRAVQNFDITGINLSHFPKFIVALAMVKQAAARANRDLGLLDGEIAAAIDTSCQEIIEGRWHGHFVVDMVQGGAGTSTNMNANEVIANRALELMGHERGDYARCHPNNHVNLSQSTNDVYPTAIRLATRMASDTLRDALTELQGALRKKGEEFRGVLKMGRTQLQDAVPMTLGQEFCAFSNTTGEDIARLDEVAVLFLESNLGGTAIGTGINATPDYAGTVLQHLHEISGFELQLSADLVEASPDTGDLVSFSGLLKRVAVKLSKLCNDLRLLSSGPRCGLNEINLPPMQPGSSIMPGKVNPVIPEVLNQVAFQVVGNDLTITMAAEAAQLQLNVMEPIIVFNLFQSIEMMSAGIRTLVRRCIEGITANVDHSRNLVDRSIGIVTALVPTLGYDRTSEVAKVALKEDRSVREVVLEKGYLTAEQLEELLAVKKMTAPR